MNSFSSKFLLKHGVLLTLESISILSIRAAFSLMLEAAVRRQEMLSKGNLNLLKDLKDAAHGGMGRALERSGRILKWYEKPLTDRQKKKRASTRMVDMTSVVFRWLSR